MLKIPALNDLGGLFFPLASFGKTSGLNNSLIIKAELWLYYQSLRLGFHLSFFMILY
jgi:hypothetical protein